MAGNRRKRNKAGIYLAVSYADLADGVFFYFQQKKQMNRR